MMKPDLELLIPPKLTDDQIIDSLCADGCERMEAYYASGPVAKATVLSFADSVSATRDAQWIEYLKIEREKTKQLSELLSSAYAIALRKGNGTAWNRFAKSIENLGISPITARTYRILKSDIERDKILLNKNAVAIGNALAKLTKEERIVLGWGNFLLPTWVELPREYVDTRSRALSGYSVDYINGYESGMEAAEYKLKEINNG